MQKVDIKAIVKNLNKEELRDLNKIVRNCYILRIKEIGALAPIFYVQGNHIMKNLMNNL